MYPHRFHYYRAQSLQEASSMLSELGEEARPLAGGQSLLPLMKMRLASPAHLVDLNFIRDLSYITKDETALRFGAMTRHAEIEASADAQQIPILHDCAAGIADAQVRNRGTFGGSLAEADPSGDWAPVLLTLSTKAAVVGPQGERVIKLSELFVDAYTTALALGELLREIVVEIPPPKSGGAYLAFKRCAPVYATASVAVQLTLDDKEVCRAARIALGCVGLSPIRPVEAERALQGRPVTHKTIEDAAEAASAAAEPQSDIRGSAEYKRALVAALTKRAVQIALRRCRGERVEGSHIYA